MRLTPKEMDRLTIFTVAEMARRRKARGLKLNHPEAMALISDELLEDGRAGLNYEEIEARGTTILSKDDVMDGVEVLVSSIRLEVNFADGNKLVVIDNPIR